MHFNYFLPGADKGVPPEINILSFQIWFQRGYNLQGPGVSAPRLSQVIVFWINLCKNQTHDFDLIMTKIWMYSPSLWTTLVKFRIHSLKSVRYLLKLYLKEQALIYESNENYLG